MATQQSGRLHETNNNDDSSNGVHSKSGNDVDSARDKENENDNRSTKMIIQKRALLGTCAANQFPSDRLVLEPIMFATAPCSHAAQTGMLQVLSVV